MAEPLLAASAERRGVGLSAKLLFLTLIFVMLAGVLIFVPSVANFRVNWLNDRLTAAQLAALAAEAVPGGVVPEALRAELLRTAQVRAVALKRSRERRLPSSSVYSVGVALCRVARLSQISTSLRRALQASRNCSWIACRLSDINKSCASPSGMPTIPMHSPAVMYSALRPV